MFSLLQLFPAICLRDIYLLLFIFCDEYDHHWDKTVEEAIAINSEKNKAEISL